MCAPTVQSLMRYIQQALTSLGVFTATPWAFVFVGLYAIGWAYVEPTSLDLHGVATLATWLMTLVIQRATYRDTLALHAKLDELLRAERRARDSLTRIDREEPEVIKQLRDEAEPAAR